MKKVRRILDQLRPASAGFDRRAGPTSRSPSTTKKITSIALRCRAGGIVPSQETKVHFFPLERQRSRAILVVGPDAWPAQPVAGRGQAGKQFPFQRSVFWKASPITWERRPSGLLRARPPPRMIDLANSTEFSYGGAKRGARRHLETFPNGDLSGAPLPSKSPRS